MIPVRNAGHDDVAQIMQHIRERLTVCRRRLRQRRAHRAGVHAASYRRGAGVLEVLGDPVNGRMCGRAELIG